MGVYCSRHRSSLTHNNTQSKCCQDQRRPSKQRTSLFRRKQCTPEPDQGGSLAFGASLGDLRLREDAVFQLVERDSPAAEDERVPEILHALVYWMCCKERFKIPFIFRSDGDSIKTQRLQDAITACVRRDESVTAAVIDAVEEVDALAVATVIKRFLKQLQQPLLTFDICDSLLALQNEGASNEKMLELILDALPNLECATIGFLLRFLALVVQFQAENRISVDAISILFSSSLFRLRYESELDALRSIKQRCGLIRLLVLEVCRVRDAASDSITSNNSNNNNDSGITHQHPTVAGTAAS